MNDLSVSFNRRTNGRTLESDSIRGAGYFCGVESEAGH